MAKIIIDADDIDGALRRIKVHPTDIEIAGFLKYLEGAPTLCWGKLAHEWRETIQDYWQDYMIGKRQEQ